jgi:hypothetical protein
MATETTTEEKPTFTKEELSEINSVDPGEGGDAPTGDAGDKGQDNQQKTDAGAESDETSADDGDTSLLDLDDDDGEGEKAEGDKTAEGEGEGEGDKDKSSDPDKDKAPASNAWAKERDAAADQYIKKIEKKLSVDKDGKPLSARQKQANIDDAKDKFLSKLARYPSLTAALIAGINAQDKISSGKYKAPLPDDATDEEKAAWRKDNDIPDEASGYKIPKVQGQEWTEADKPGLDKFLGRMHEKNASQSQVDAALTTYRELIAEAKEAHAENLKAIDKADTQATRDALRDEFEGEFKPAMTLLKRLVDDAEVFPDDAGKVLANARDPETGKRIINNPVIAKFLIENAKDRYGEGAMLSGDRQAAVNSEEAELYKLMNTDIDEFNHRTWKTTGMTGSERLMEIRRRKEASGRGRRAA